MGRKHTDIYSYFPMQAALGLYSVHKYPPGEDDEEYEEYEEYDEPPAENDSLMHNENKEIGEQCISKKATSATTKDTKR